MAKANAVGAQSEILLGNIRLTRDAAAQACVRAVSTSKKLEGTVLTLSTLTAGSLWFLCASSGPAWLSVAVKWLGALFATVCAVLTAHKEKITNHRKLADRALDCVRALEEMIARTEAPQTRPSLVALHTEYRGVKAELIAIAAELGVRPHIGLSIQLPREGFELLQHVVDDDALQSADGPGA